jgi:hypothetical protein
VAVIAQHLEDEGSHVMRMDDAKRIITKFDRAMKMQNFYATILKNPYNLLSYLRMESKYQSINHADMAS